MAKNQMVRLSSAIINKDLTDFAVLKEVQGDKLLNPVL